MGSDLHTSRDDDASTGLPNVTSGSVNFPRNSSTWDDLEDTEIKLFPGDPASKKNLRRFATKGYSEYFDPCQEAADMSRRCIERNTNNREVCKPFFEVYRDCSRAWKKKRKQSGI